MIAILIIGDELLSGAVREENLPLLIETLNGIGYSVGEVRIVGDSVDSIAEAVSALSRRWRYLFTSGGIGPTHDDVTLAGMAQAFSIGLVEHPQMLEFLRSRHGDDLPPAAQRLALLPDGAEVLSDERVWPLIRLRNCFALPGLPRAFRAKMRQLPTLLTPLERRWVASLYTNIGEIALTDILAGVQDRHPTVAIGSYPANEPAEWRVKITVSSITRAATGEVLSELCRRVAEIGGTQIVEEPFQR